MTTVLYENRHFEVERDTWASREPPGITQRTTIMFGQEYSVDAESVVHLAFWLLTKGSQSDLRQEMAEVVASISDADLREVGQRIQHQLVLRRMCNQSYGGTG